MYLLSCWRRNKMLKYWVILKFLLLGVTLLVWVTCWKFSIPATIRLSTFEVAGSNPALALSPSILTVDVCQMLAQVGRFFTGVFGLNPAYSIIHGIVSYIIRLLNPEKEKLSQSFPHYSGWHLVSWVIWHSFNHKKVHIIKWSFIEGVVSLRE